MNPEKTKLICGVIFNNEVSPGLIRKTLEKKLGPIDFESSVLDFTYTDYYTPEMGTPLKRIFYAFRRLRNADGLYKIKIKTNRIERMFTKTGRRRVNIDPGYLTPAKLVLFSTKNFSHRIYMGKSIFSELTLRYEKGEFTSLPWTFPDYSTASYSRILHAIRDLYTKQVKNGD